MDWLLILALHRYGSLEPPQTWRVASVTQCYELLEHARLSETSDALCVPAAEYVCPEPPEMAALRARAAGLEAELAGERTCRQQGDLDCDGLVGPSDFTAFMASYGGTNE